MKSLEELEKIINSELTSKVENSKIKHNQIYIEILEENLMEVVLFIQPPPDSFFMP